jgi:hypothetical protein
MGLATALRLASQGFRPGLRCFRASGAACGKKPRLVLSVRRKLPSQGFRPGLRCFRASGAACGEKPGLVLSVRRKRQTKAAAILRFVHGVQGSVHVTLEVGGRSWLGGWYPLDTAGIPLGLRTKIGRRPSPSLRKGALGNYISPLGIPAPAARHWSQMPCSSSFISSICFSSEDRPGNFGGAC